MKHTILWNLFFLNYSSIMQQFNGHWIYFIIFFKFIYNHKYGKNTTSSITRIKRTTWYSAQRSKYEKKRNKSNQTLKKAFETKLIGREFNENNLADDDHMSIKTTKTMKSTL